MKKFMALAFMLAFCVLVGNNCSAASISVIFPNGGEKFKAGDVMDIKWQSQGLSLDSMVGIWLLGEDWTLNVNITNAKGYSWIVPANVRISNYVKIHLALFNEDGSVNGNVTDESDNYFSIIPARSARSTPSCSDECILGQTQSVGNGIQTCGNYDADPCLEWGPIIPCPNGQQSINGKCVNVFKIPLKGMDPAFFMEFNESITVVTDNPGILLLGEVNVYQRHDDNKGWLKITTGFTIAYKQLGKKDVYRVIEIKAYEKGEYAINLRVVRVNVGSCSVWETSDGKKIEHFVQITPEIFQGAPSKAQTGNVGKQLTTMGKIKTQG